ncbi:MAG: enoyl-CoA hydratase/isomerase family protein [Caulobacterales bacterium]
MTYTALALDVSGHVATLEFRRPDRGNAFDEALHSEFSNALSTLRANKDIRVILISAQGKTFSAGGDFDYLLCLNADKALRDRTLNEGRNIFRQLSEIEVPIVAAAQGHAAGVGATVLTACDVSVVWRGAKIGDPHVLIGLTAGDGGAITWSAAIGFNRARRILLTGDSLAAPEAHQLGLITDLVDNPEDALPVARQIAEKIASLPPMAVQSTKRAFNAIAAARTGDAADRAMVEEMDCIASEDLREAVAATRERRAGNYKNR